MSLEFDIIKKHFTRPSSNTDLGIGDDAALIQVSAGQQLAVSADMSVAGIHFFESAAPYDIGWKSLAVNISDMAAMGANPKWATLSLALPDINESWLSAFSAGFFDCAKAFGVALIGGDTTRGPLNISVTIMGEVPIGKALTRCNAQVGDDIWVSGQLGHAALGLAHLQGKLRLAEAERDICLQALHQPQPRVSLGLALLEVAHSCIDISDGLLADLGHILKASNLGASIDLEKIPCNHLLKDSLDSPQSQRHLLAGGDDYELCFTAPTNQRKTIDALSTQLSLPIALIGTTLADTGLRTKLKNTIIKISEQGFSHFN